MIVGSTEKLGEWITYHSKHSQEIKRIVSLFQLNEDKLFKHQPISRANFELTFPDKLNKKIYVCIIRKIFAVLRHLIYKEIRSIVRGRQSPAYLTKTEAKDVLSKLDMREVRTKVFALFGIVYDERSLVKAYYTFMSDRTFTEQVRQSKQAHERFMTAILSCDVFPGLDKVDPLSSPDEDLVPEKFGPNWFKHNREEPTPRKFEGLVGEDGEVDEDALDEIDCGVEEPDS